MFKRINEHFFYLASLAIKAFDGAMQLIGSFFVLFFGIDKIPQFINYLFREELIEDPHDIIANFFIHSVQRIDFSFKYAAFLYLFSHGAVKIFLVVSLLRKKLWAYPLSEAVLAFFIVYQTYSFLLSHSVFMLFFNIVDIILMFLVWIEYKKAQTKFSEGRIRG